MSVTPSDRLPSVLIRPDGFLTAGMSAFEMAHRRGRSGCSDVARTDYIRLHLRDSVRRSTNVFNLALNRTATTG